MKTKPTTRVRVDFDLKVAPETDVPVRGNALASGDDKLDRETEDEILRRLSRGDVLAWCCITVTARIVALGQRFEGRAHLGACSYLDERGLRQDYNDLKQLALDDLKAQLSSTVRVGKDAAEALKTLN